MPVLQDPGFSVYKKPKAPAPPNWSGAVGITPELAPAPVYVPPGGAAGYAPGVTPYTPPPAAPSVPAAAPAPAAAAPSAPAWNYQNAPISDILGSDPFYQQLLGLDKAGSQEDQAWMQQQIHQQQRYYGSAGDPLSLLGQIAVRYQDTLKQVENNLASRGMIFSGEFGARGNRARQDMEWGNVQANFQLQQYIAGLKQGFTQQQRARKQSELQEQMNAVTRWLQTHQPTPPPLDLSALLGGA
jgi:hypothetical protein